MDRERRWAAVRVGLGTLQTIGATVSLLLLLQSGASRPATVATAVTAALTLTSLLLFRGT